MWKLFIFTIFVCLFLTTSCRGTSSNVNSGSSSSSAAAASQTTSTETEKISKSDPWSGQVAAKSKNVTTVTETEAESSSITNGGLSSSSSSANANSQTSVTSTDTRWPDDGSSSEEDEEDYDSRCNLEERDDDYDCSNAVPRVKQAITKINFQFLNYFIKKNFVNNNYYCAKQMQAKQGINTSPLATWYTTAFMALYSEKETLDELLAYTGLNNKDECRCLMKHIKRRIKPLFTGLYYYSPSIEADYKYEFTDLIFERDVFEYYDTKAYNTDFSKPERAAKIENKKAASRSNGTILDIVSKNEASIIYNKDQIIIFNVGTYLKPVFKLNTEKKTKGIYYGMNEPTLTYYYNQEYIYDSTVSRVLNSRLVQIPLQNKNTVCLAIIPNTRCGLPFLVEKLASKPQILLEAMDWLKPTRIHLTVPVYKNITTAANLVPILEETGEINLVFDKTKSQVIDSCGRSLNRSVTYIHDKTISMFTTEGVGNSTVDFSKYGEAVDVFINYPAVFVFIVDGVIVQSTIGDVVEVDSFLNK